MLPLCANSMEVLILDKRLIKKGKMIACSNCGAGNYYKLSHATRYENHFCNLTCKGKYQTKQLFIRVPKEVIYRLYITEQRAYRYICKKLHINGRAIPILLNGYGIPIRYGSEAVATQWIDNDHRRKTQAVRFAENIADTFRENATPAEKRFRHLLRYLGIEFEFQYPVDGFLLDFAIPSIKLGIEIDGKEHRREKKVRFYDEQRTEQLAKLGWLILRFSNFDVLNYPIKVRKQIGAIIHRLEQ